MSEMYSLEGDDLFTAGPEAGPETPAAAEPAPATGPTTAPVKVESKPTRQRIRRGPAAPKILGAGLARDVDQEVGQVFDQVPFVVYTMDGSLCVELCHAPKKSVMVGDEEKSALTLDLEDAGFEYKTRLKRWVNKSVNVDMGPSLEAADLILQALPTSFVVSVKG